MTPNIIERARATQKSLPSHLDWQVLAHEKVGDCDLTITRRVTVRDSGHLRFLYIYRIEDGLRYIEKSGTFLCGETFNEFYDCVERRWGGWPGTTVHALTQLRRAVRRFFKTVYVEAGKAIRRITAAH